MKNFTLAVLSLLSWAFVASAQPTILEPVVNGGRWSDPATWNLNRIPADGDIVTIPSGMTVNVKNNNYSLAGSCPSNGATSPRLIVNVFGSLAFEPSGRLNLGCASVLFLSPGARIFSTTRNCSLRINIGPNEVWGCNGPLTTDEIIGPATINNGGILPAPLPVVMDLFRANRQNNVVRLEWSTVQEINSKQFTIERSSDAGNWSAIGSLPAAGNSNSRVHYNFTDPNPLNGNNFYRIRQIDEDGKISFSGIARVGSSAVNRLFVYPNPVISMANIVLGEGARSNQSVQLFNGTGAMVRSVPVKNGNLLQLNMEGLKPGLYLIRVLEDGKVVEQTSFLKQ